LPSECLLNGVPDLSGLQTVKISSNRVDSEFTLINRADVGFFYGVKNRNKKEIKKEN